jgi:hypothetical protein
MPIAAILAGWPRPLISQHRADKPRAPPVLLKKTAKTGYQFLRPTLELGLKEIGW